MVSRRTEVQLTDTAEYAGLVAGLPGGSIGTDLASVGRLRAAVDELTRRMVADARARGYTWEEIGQPLGMSRQGAQQLAKRAKRDE